MISAKDKQRLVYDVIAQNGGLDNIDLASELSKVLSSLNRDILSTRATMPQDNGQMTAPQVLQAPISPPVAQESTQDPNAPNQGGNAPISPNTPPGM